MNTLTRTGWTCLLLIVAAGCAGTGGKKEQILRGGGREWDRMKVIRPRRYVAGKAQEKIAVDGKADEPSWKLARWTNYFVDISGDPAPKPWFRTRAKIIWDDQCLYVYAEIEEPHVWAPDGWELQIDRRRGPDEPSCHSRLDCLGDSRLRPEWNDSRHNVRRPY